MSGTSTVHFCTCKEMQTARMRWEPKIARQTNHWVYSSTFHWCNQWDSMLGQGYDNIFVRPGAPPAAPVHFQASGRGAASECTYVSILHIHSFGMLLTTEKGDRRLNKYPRFTFTNYTAGPLPARYLNHGLNTCIDTRSLVNINDTCNIISTACTVTRVG
jgi:hypothetical protein